MFHLESGTGKIRNGEGAEGINITLFTGLDTTK